MASPITISVNFIDLTGNTVLGYMQAAIQSPTGVYNLYVTGTGILVPKISTSSTGTSVSVSVWGNDVIVDNADGAKDTYYVVTLFNTSNIPVWTASYSFTGAGPINLVGYPTLTSVPVPTTSVPINILTGNNIFTGTNAFTPSTPSLTAFTISGSPIFNALNIATASGVDPTGTTDSYAGIQGVYNTACTNASGIPKTVQTVLWPSGTYLLTKPIHVACNGLNTLSYGRNTAIKSLVAHGPQMVTAPSPANGYCMSGSSCSATVNLTSGLTSSGGNAINFTDDKSWFELRDDTNEFELNNATALTIEAIYNPTNLSGNHYIIGSQGKRGENEAVTTAFYLGTSGNNATVSLHCSNASPQLITATLSTGTTYHIEGAWDGSTLRLYVNGIFGTSATCQSPLVMGNAEDVRIGNLSADWPEGGVAGAAPRGAVDSVRISNIARHTTNSNYTDTTTKLTSDGNTLALFNWGNCYDIFCDVQTKDGTSYIPIRVNGIVNQAAITNVIVDGLTFNGGTSGLYNFYTLNSIFRNNQFLISGPVAHLLWGNSYENKISDELFNGGARIQLAMSQAAGDIEIDNPQIIGGKYQIVSLNGSGSITQAVLGQSTSTILGMLLKGSGGVGNSIGTWTITNPLCDVENGGSSYTGCLMLSALGSATVTAGELDSLGGGVSSNSVLIDGGGPYTFVGTRYSNSGTLNSPFHVINASTQLITLINNVQAQTFQTWFDASTPFKIVGPGYQDSEIGAPNGFAGMDQLWSDAAAHRWKMNNNNAGADTVGDVLTQSCGITSTCSGTNVRNPQIIQGSAPLVSGTPSIVTITGFSPAFTSTTSYNCTVTNQTNAANSALKVVNTSASSITITGPNTITDIIGYICAGN